MNGLMEHMGIYLEEVDGELYVDSLQVAERFGKEHKNVLRDIENLDCSQEFFGKNFKKTEYIDKRGRKQTKCLMTRDGLVLMVMSFTGQYAAQWKVKLIEAFGRMDVALREPFPPKPEGCEKKRVYLCLFFGGIVKVGVSKSPDARRKIFEASRGERAVWQVCSAELPQSRAYGGESKLKNSLEHAKKVGEFFQLGHSQIVDALVLLRQLGWRQVKEGTEGWLFLQNYKTVCSVLLHNKDCRLLEEVPEKFPALYWFIHMDRSAQDLLHKMDHNSLVAAERGVGRCLRECMDKKMYYKDIYQECKKRVLQLADFVGVSDVSAKYLTEASEDEEDC